MRRVMGARSSWKANLAVVPAKAETQYAETDARSSLAVAFANQKPSPKRGGARSEQELAQDDVLRLSSAARDISLLSTAACLTNVRSVAGRFACARSLALVLTSCFSSGMAKSEDGDLSLSDDED